MPLTTLTFETLRERNQRSLDRVGFTPDGTTETLAARQRKRIETLLDKRTHIEDLATTQDQRTDYDVEQFHSEFSMLRDIHSHPHAKYEWEMLRWHIWSAVPNSRFKRFQELFSHEHHFVVPHFEIDTKGTVHFPKGIDFHALSLRPCLVSPDRIPDEFAQSIGICTFTEDDSPLMRLEKKRKAISSLKLIFESAEQVQTGHNRVLAISNPSPEVSELYGSPKVPDPKTLGTILYVREHGGVQDNRNLHPRTVRHSKGDPRPPRSLIVQHFTSVYEAHRKTYHERRVHTQEIDRLSELAEELKAFNRTLDSDWKGDTKEDRKFQLQKQTYDLLAACTEELQFCENQYKVRSRDLLRDCRTLIEKRNVSAAMSKMVAAVESLKRRFQEMYPKGGFNQQDQMALQKAISSHEVILKLYRKSIVNVAMQKENSGKAPATTRVRLPTHSLEHLTLEPFRTYAINLKEKHGNYEAALDRDPDAARDMLIQSHIIGKFQAVRTCFEHIKLWLVDGESIPIGSIRNFVSTLNAIFAPRQIYPEHTVSEYEAPFEEMRSKLQSIEKRLTQYEGQDLDVDSRTAIYRDLKGYLDTFDIETIVRELS